MVWSLSSLHLPTRTSQNRSDSPLNTTRMDLLQAGSKYLQQIFKFPIYVVTVRRSKLRSISYKARRKLVLLVTKVYY